MDVCACVCVHMCVRVHVLASLHTWAHTCMCACVIASLRLLGRICTSLCSPFLCKTVYERENDAELLIMKCTFDQSSVFIPQSTQAGCDCGRFVQLWHAGQKHLHSLHAASAHRICTQNMHWARSICTPCTRGMHWEPWACLLFNLVLIAAVPRGSGYNI